MPNTPSILKPRVAYKALSHDSGTRLLYRWKRRTEDGLPLGEAAAKPGLLPAVGSYCRVTATSPLADQCVITRPR